MLAMSLLLAGFEPATTAASMAIDRPRTIDDAPAGRPPQGRSAAEDVGGETFLPREEWANRGPRGACPVGWKAQGKKVDPTALRLRRSRRSRSSARSGHQEARCVRALKQHPQEKTWRTPVLPHKVSASSGAEIEAIAQKKAASFAGAWSRPNARPQVRGLSNVRRDGVQALRRGLSSPPALRFWARIRQRRIAREPCSPRRRPCSLRVAAARAG